MGEAAKSGGQNFVGNERTVDRDFTGDNINGIPTINDFSGCSKV